jgi:hypothetical protein
MNQNPADRNWRDLAVYLLIFIFGAMQFGLSPTTGDFQGDSSIHPERDGVRIQRTPGNDVTSGLPASTSAPDDHVRNEVRRSDTSDDGIYNIGTVSNVRANQVTRRQDDRGGRYTSALGIAASISILNDARLLRHAVFPAEHIIPLHIHSGGKERQPIMEEDSFVSRVCGPCLCLCSYSFDRNCAGGRRVLLSHRNRHSLSG